MGAMLQAVGQIMGGNAQSAADKERALELKQQAGLVQTEAKQQMAARMNNLNTLVGGIDAVVASRGLSTSSPSAQAYAGAQKKAAYLDTTALDANAALQAGMLRESSNAALLAARNAQMNSWFSAAGTLIDAPLDTSGTTAGTALGGWLGL